MNTIRRCMHAITFLLLTLVSYGLNAMQKFDNLEELDRHLQKLERPSGCDVYDVGKDKYTLDTYFYNYTARQYLESCDLWASKESQQFSSAKLLRYNTPQPANRPNYTITNNRPSISCHTQAGHLINYLVLPAQPNQPGFFAIKDLAVDTCWLEDKNSSQGTVKRYKKIGQTGWTVRNWFTVSEMQGDIDKKATVDYKPREAENFTSLEVTVTEDLPKNVKTTQTRLNKTTCVSLIAGVVGAWLTWSHWRSR